jgi:hypothetical protein
VTHTWCVLVALLSGVGVGALVGYRSGWGLAFSALGRMVERGEVVLADKGGAR